MVKQREQRRTQGGYHAGKRGSVRLDPTLHSCKGRNENVGKQYHFNFIKARFLPGKSLHRGLVAEVGRSAGFLLDPMVTGFSGPLEI